MTQNEKIMRRLDVYGTITPLDAMREYGIMRLASRISDLKKEGAKISRRMITDKNRFGEPVRYAEYRKGD